MAEQEACAELVEKASQEQSGGGIEESQDSEDDETSTIKAPQNNTQQLQNNPIYQPGLTHEEKCNRFNTKKLKMKRANTIDIPKPLGYYEDDEETDDEDARRNNYYALRGPIRVSDVSNVPKTKMPVFEPKTDSDKKFLAFINKHNENSGQKASLWAQKTPVWGNKFGNIKSNFEGKDKRNSAMSFWKSADDSVTGGFGNGQQFGPKISRRSAKNLQQMFEEKQKQRLGNENVVTGSLKVHQVKDNLVPVNKFSHAPQSAFKPLPKKEPKPDSLPIPPADIIKTELKADQNGHETSVYLYSPKPLMTPQTDSSSSSPIVSKPWVANTGEHRVLSLAAQKFENHHAQEPQTPVKPRKLSKDFNKVFSPQAQEKLSSPYMVKTADNKSGSVRKLSGQFDSISTKPADYSTHTTVKYIHPQPDMVNSNYQPQNYSFQYPQPQPQYQYGSPQQYQGGPHQQYPSPQQYQGAQQYPGTQQYPGAQHYPGAQQYPEAQYTGPQQYTVAQQYPAAQQYAGVQQYPQQYQGMQPYQGSTQHQVAQQYQGAPQYQGPSHYQGPQQFQGVQPNPAPQQYKQAPQTQQYNKQAPQQQSPQPESHGYTSQVNYQQQTFPQAQQYQSQPQQYQSQLQQYQSQPQQYQSQPPQDQQQYTSSVQFKPQPKAQPKAQQERPKYETQVSNESVHEYNAVNSKLMTGPVQQSAVTVTQKGPMTRDGHDMAAALGKSLSKIGPQTKSPTNAKPTASPSNSFSYKSPSQNSGDSFKYKTEINSFNKSPTQNSFKSPTQISGDSFKYKSPTSASTTPTSSFKYKTTTTTDNKFKPVDAKPIQASEKRNCGIVKPTIQKQRTVSTDRLEINDDGESVVTSKFHIPVISVPKSEAKPPSHAQVLSKSESWNQICMQAQKPSPRESPTKATVVRSKSSHSLAVPKMYEAGLTKDEMINKRKTMEAYLTGKKSPQTETATKTVKKSTINRIKTSEKRATYRQSTGLSRSRTLPDIVCPELLDESNVDKAFEDLFKSSS